MTARIWLRLAETLVPALITAAIILSWQADRRDRAQLATQLAAAQQTVAEAASRQKDRDAALNQTLAQISAQQKTFVTPEQIVKALPQVLGLPAPLAVQPAEGRTPSKDAAQAFPVAHPSRGEASPDDTSTAASAYATTLNSGHSSENLPNNPAPKQNSTAPNAAIPAEDLKPLYDFALDCHACQAKLTAAQSDLADEKIKSAVLTKERDAALRAAKGGSALRRAARAAKWFLIGAAAGAVASKALH